MSYLSGNTQPRGNQPMHPDEVQNHFYSCLPGVPSADEQHSLTEGFETPYTYQPLWVANMSCYGGIPPGSVDSPVGFPLEDTDMNIRGEGELGLLGSLTLDQPPTIATNGISLVPPFSTIATQSPSVSSATLLPPQVQPAPPVHRYQCTTCLKRFDRESRLENCHNRHSGIKPHRCFGVCGTVQCLARYASIEQLNRHLTRLVLCSSCGKARSKQNMARHRASCGGSQ